MSRWVTATAIVMALVSLVAFGPVAEAQAAKRPVARWDTIPDQRLDGPFKVGLCAFHTGGVAVEFYVNGGLVHTAAAPTYNDRTNVWEHWFTLDPSPYADGPLTVTARAVPQEAGAPSYDLPSLNLYANSHGTLNVATVKWADSVNGSDSNAGTEAAPYKTLAKAVQNTPSGGTINLKAGSYASGSLGGGSNRPYWTTIQAAPGVARDNVEISAGRPGTQRLKLKDLTIFLDYTGGYSTILTGEQGAHIIWLDNVKAWNKQGRWAASSTTFGNVYPAFLTGGLTTEMANGPGGSIIRGHTIYRLTSDAWTGSEKLVVNSQCINIDPGTTGAHPDFHQSYTVAPNFVENVILYNVRGYECLSQGLFGSRLRDSAFVNVLFERSTNTVMYSQYSGPMENVLFLHTDIINQSWLWRGDYTPDEVQVINCIFRSMQVIESASAVGLTVDYCHFEDPTRAMGTHQTTGDPQYVDHHDPLVDPSDRDYHLQATSPAYGTGRYLQCVPADIDGQMFNPTGRNRGAQAMDWAVETPLEVERWEVTGDPAGGEPRLVVTDGESYPALGGAAAVRAAMNLPVDPSTLAGDKVTLTSQRLGDVSDQIMSVSLADGGQTIVILMFDTLADGDRYTVTLDATIAPTAGEPLTGDRDLLFGCLAGDVDSSGVVTAADVLAVRQKVGTAPVGADLRYDLDGTGGITAADMRAARSRLGGALP